MVIRKVNMKRGSIIIRARAISGGVLSLINCSFVVMPRLCPICDSSIMVHPCLFIQVTTFPLSSECTSIGVVATILYLRGVRAILSLSSDGVPV